MTDFDAFDLKYTSREVTAWGGLALLKRMMDGMGLRGAIADWDLPAPGSNRGYAPVQLIEQMIVSIWCGAARFCHADITRLDATLTRLFDWPRAAGHKAIVRLFQRFSQADANRVAHSSYRWLFDKLSLNPITLDVDSTVMTRWGGQIEGASKGYNPKHHGRNSHHPLLAFVSDWRLVANLWLRPGSSHTANNALAFLEATLANLGQTTVGLFRADSGFYDKAIVAWLQAKKISHIISARLTTALQQAIVDQCKWQEVAPGIEVSELRYQAIGWQQTMRFVVVRQHVRRASAAGKTLSLFADDPDLQGWRYGAMVTDLTLPAVEVWRLYRGRADCENRIKELKADFGLDSFVLRDFWATEAALSVAMLSYNLMSVFRHAVLRQKVHHTLSTLHHKVLAVGAYWDKPSADNKPTIRLAIAKKRRPWFEGLWAQAGEPVELKRTASKF
ncbi:MAG: IS1380 family transposase [Brachymonas sp.]|nr:IS1380 family transposase [Brachymonas sp.]